MILDVTRLTLNMNVVEDCSDLGKHPLASRFHKVSDSWEEAVPVQHTSPQYGVIRKLVATVARLFLTLEV